MITMLTRLIVVTILQYIQILNHIVHQKVILYVNYTFSSVQSLSHVQLFATPWTSAHQTSLSITNSQSPPKPMSIKLVMLSNHLILCRPLLLLPSIFPGIRVFSNQSALHIRWPKYWSFNFNISSSKEHPGLIFRMDWFLVKNISAYICQNWIAWMIFSFESELIFGVENHFANKFYYEHWSSIYTEISPEVHVTTKTPLKQLINLSATKCHWKSWEWTYLI